MVYQRRIWYQTERGDVGATMTGPVPSQFWVPARTSTRARQRLLTLTRRTRPRRETDGAITLQSNLRHDGHGCRHHRPGGHHALSFESVAPHRRTPATRPLQHRRRILHGVRGPPRPPRTRRHRGNYRPQPVRRVDYRRLRLRRLVDSLTRKRLRELSSDG